MPTIPATQEGELWKIGTGDQTRKNVRVNLSHSINKAWRFMPIIPVMREAEVGPLWSEVGP
jgi:hypothetical protein